MKICLIRPPQLVTMHSLGNKAAAPLGVALIAGSVEKAGYEVFT